MSEKAKAESLREPSAFALCLPPPYLVTLKINVSRSLE